MTATEVPRIRGLGDSARARVPDARFVVHAAADDRRVIRKCDVVDSRRHVPPRSSVSRRLAGVFTEDDEWRRHLDL